MKGKALNQFSFFVGIFFIGLTLLHSTASAQSTKTTAVTVTNTPTVQIDPNANTVKVDPLTEVMIGHRDPYTSLQKHDWIGQLLVSFQNINNGTTFTKARVCVTNQNANPASVTIMSWIFASDGSGRGFPIETFELAAASSGCRLIDEPGAKVDVFVSSNNTAGQAWVGFWGIY